jgi:hypothetical protein
MKDAGQRRYGAEFSRAQHVLDHMRQEYMEIVDEIATQTVTDEKLFLQVKEMLKHEHEPARMPPVDTDSSDSEPYSKEEKIDGNPLDERKLSAVDETDTAIRKEVAKAIASLGKNPTLHHTATQEAAKDEPANKADQSQSKKQRASTVGTKRKRLVVSIVPTRNRKKGKTIHKQENDIPDVEDDYKGPRDSPQRQPMETGTMCHAGLSCHMDDINVVVKGSASNGSLCCKCKQTFHYVCLFAFEGDKYCLKCYKEYVVSQCKTETLFEDLLGSKGRAKTQTGPKHTSSDLVKFVDNFLKVHGLGMTMNEYYEWRKGGATICKEKTSP